MFQEDYVYEAGEVLVEFGGTMIANEPGSRLVVITPDGTHFVERGGVRSKIRNDMRTGSLWTRKGSPSDAHLAQLQQSGAIVALVVSAPTGEALFQGSAWVDGFPVGSNEREWPLKLTGDNS